MTREPSPPSMARNGVTFESPAFEAGGPGTDYDALADLFLGDGATLPVAAPATRSGSPAVPAAAGGIMIEGLIIGHLPVLASAWVTQYAKHLAEQDRRPVGLLRLRGGMVSVEVVLPLTGGAGVQPAVQATFETGLAEAARLVSRWVVRVDELTEARLTEIEGVDGVTLLTGADEAAVVASYRTIKLMCERTEDGSIGMPLGVAVMGSTPERAREAAERLSRTASIHLGRGLPLSACVAQVGPGRSIGVFRGETTEPAEALLRRAMGIVRGAAPADKERARTPEGQRSQAALRSAPSVEPAPAADRSPIQAGMDPLPAPARSVGGCKVRLVSASESDAQWDSAPSDGSAPDGGPPDLVTHIRGLTGLATGSPYAPDVRIAFDESGAVHLLAWGGAAGGEPGVVRQLVEAAAWAAAHDSLLRLAAGRPAAASATPPTAPPPPVLHLFTADARAVRRLLDAAIRVHVLSPVPTGARWVIADLN